MDSTRLHGPAPPSAAPFPAALPGAARHSEGPASRRRPDLRLVWSADRTGNQPARAPGPAEAVAPHRGAACRLFSPAPAPTSSAPRLRERWVLEFEPTGRREPDRLIGWVGGADPLEQVRLEFPSRGAALAYAERYGLACEVSEPHRRSITPKPYAENFLAVPEPELWPELLLAA
jgi:hypothetical protein